MSLPPGQSKPDKCVSPTVSTPSAERGAIKVEVKTSSSGPFIRNVVVNDRLVATPPHGSVIETVVRHLREAGLR